MIPAPFSDGTILRSPIGQLYLVTNGIIRNIPDWNTYLAMGFQPDQWINQTADQLASYNQNWMPYPVILPPPPDDGAIADQALAWLPANLPGGKSNAIYQSWRAQIVAALGSGILDPGGQYGTRTGKCSGSPSPQGITGVQISETALSIAGTGATSGLAIAGVAGATIPIVGAAVAAGSILIQLFSKLFGPATSALEQKYLCPLVSSANAVLLQIVSELNGGQITAAQAGAAFDSLQSQFHGQLLQPVPNAGPLLYYNTPNDSQFMDSSLGALGIKYKTFWYPQLEAAANGVKAAQQAAQAAAQAAAATALQQQIRIDVATAVAASQVPASQVPAMQSASIAVPVAAVPIAAQTAAVPVSSNSAAVPFTAQAGQAAVSSTPAYAILGVVAAIVALLLFL